MTQNAADLYLRLSLDRDGKTSIERQDADCSAWCERNGLQVRQRHVDRGRSGYKRRVKRAGFDAALEAVTSGAVSTLIVWKLDRLSRQGIGQVGQALDAVDEVGGRIVFVQDGLDTSQPQARMVIALLAEQARSESVNIGLRVKAAKSYLRASGKWLGGRPPYGLLLDDSGELIHDPERAPVIRRLVDGYLGGTTMVHLARELNADGVEPARGPSWTAGTVAQLLKSPTLAGLLPRTVQRPDGTYTAEVVPYRDPETGDTIEVCEPLITATERAKIHALIEERTTEGFHGRRAKRKASALLTGLVWCECGARMSASGNSYVCGAARNGGSCTGARVMTSRLDAYVSERWRDRLAEAAASVPIDAEDDVDVDPLLIAVAERWSQHLDPAGAEERAELDAQIADREARLEDLEAARYERGEFADASGMERYRRLHDRMSAQLRAVRERRAELGNGALNVGGLLEPDVVLEAWEASDDNDLRRELLAMAFDRVVVTKAKGRGYRFKPEERVTIEEARAEGR